MKFKVGCFYSEDTLYQQIYQDYLLKSCKKFNLDCNVLSSPNYNSWNRNVSEKPRVISEMLDLFLDKGELLVFLDADCTIEQYPYLFEQIPPEYDIGFHTLNWNDWYGYNNTPPTMELLTGTMFFRNRKKVRELCREWYSIASKTKEWEQKVLQKIIGKYDLKIYPLPLEYCYIKSRPQNKPPLVKLDPVILHHQVSRELKKRRL